MSNFLAVGAVTALLKDLLTEGLVQRRVPDRLDGSISVETAPPDVIEAQKKDLSLLNLFLYRVSPNAGWRNVGLPTFDGQGARVDNPPLALDLHYLLMAYGRKDFYAEILLGYAMQLLHESSLLTRAAIRQKQQRWAAGNDKPLKDFASAGLADQAERIKISPHSMDAEEMSKLWTTFQAHYRPTAAYQVTVVLIESEQARQDALPVLTRGPADAGVVSQADLASPFPTLFAVTPPNAQASAQLGDELELQGDNLGGSDIKVRFTDARQGRVLEAAPLEGTEDRITVQLNSATAPGAPGDPPERTWSAGLYSAAALVRRPGETYLRTTNELPFSLAPMILPPIQVRRNGGGPPGGGPPGGGPPGVTFTVRCRPEVRPAQRAALLVGNLEIPAQPHPTPTDTLTFVSGSVAAGDYFVRLRVDGVDSLLVDRAATPLVYDPDQKVTVP